MILQFPDLDTFRLALTNGLVPADVLPTEVQVAFTADGRLSVETDLKLPRKAVQDLARIGVTAEKRHTGEPKPLSCWPQVLPTTPDRQPPRLSSQAPVLFELESSADLPTLVGEMLRLGNDRQSVRWLAAPDGQSADRVLLRVVGPPYYTLLRALDRSAHGTSGGVRAYLEQAPRVWVEIGHTHPFADRIQPAEGQVLLVRPDRDWTYLPEAPYRDVYEIVDFRLPATPVDWAEVPVRNRLTVPLRLVPGNATDDPELWVIRGDAVGKLDAFVRDADERIVQRLKFAVAAGPADETVIVLRVTTTRSAPPALPLAGAVGFKPYYKLPNLYVPVGSRLHPTLRRDAVRRLLADNTDELVWLYPGPVGTFTPEVIPEDSFRPLEDWVEYVIETNRAPLAAWIGASRFDFEHYVCNEGQPPRPPSAKDETGKGKRRGRSEPKVEPAESPEPGIGQRVEGDAPSATLRLAPAEELPRQPNEWLVRRQELEDQFRAVEGPLDHPDRRALWPALAEANTGYGSIDEAALCWVNALWGPDNPPREWVEGWAHSEVSDLSKPPTAADFDRRMKQPEPTAWEARQFTALVVWQSFRAPVPDWFRSRLPAIQRYLETHERRLPIRAVWLAATRLAALTGSDTLGLARVRDRLLQRLLDEGISPERDLPGFLRYAGSKDSERIRLVQKQALGLHHDVRVWTEASLKQPSLLGQPDLTATLAYVDLFFAFGLARLGESAPAKRLVESARRVLESFPPEEDLGIAGRLLFRAFRYRIDQALDGKPHAGPLEKAVLDDIDQIHAKAGGQYNNPFGMAHYAIARVREQYRILEPHEKLNPYHQWLKHGDELKRALAELPKVKDANLLARTVRELYKSGAGGTRPTAETRFYVLHETLPLAGRVGEQFTFELIDLVPDALKATANAGSQIAELPRKQGELLERALFLAAHFDRRDVVQKLVNQFIELLKTRPDDQRFELVNVVAAQSLRSLRKLGLRDEIDKLLHRMQGVILAGRTAADLRVKSRSRPAPNKADVWPKALQSLLHLAGGWLTFGLGDQAEPILDDARAELLGDGPAVLPPREFTDVARAYIAALGQGPAETGLPRIAELFQRMSPARVTSTWTTARF
jgi:hypothetical protein